jgi:predicted transcriptional regulator
MTTTTSLKLPDELRAQIAMTAKREGKTAHALMIEALQTAMHEASLMQAFQDSALAAYEETVRSSKVYRGEELKAYYLAKLRGEKAKKPSMHAWQADAQRAKANPSFNAAMSQKSA